MTETYDYNGFGMMSKWKWKVGLIYTKGVNLSLLFPIWELSSLNLFRVPHIKTKIEDNCKMQL